MTNYAMDYQGYKPGLSLQKNGGCIPELEKARAIILEIQSKKQSESIEEPQKFQLGGKMNMIVTGALHARKHDLEELNPVLEGNITKKGIPVVVMDDGGEVVNQTAEVEEHEIILASETTKTVEDYYKEFNESKSKSEKDRIALECGKYLATEILKNTDDPDKLIKKTV
jgi:predicted aconitase